MKARYINPYTDFGFKKLFGEEGSIDLLIDFLNELLSIEHKIVSLSFKNPEQVGAISAERRAIFDLRCEDEKGRKFIVEMLRFTKTEQELQSHKEKWLYFLKNLEDFEDIPDILKEAVFIKGFEIAEIANFNARQLAEYEESLKVYRDLKGVVDTSYEEGLEEGIKEGMEEGKKEKALEIARMMKTKKYTVKEIAELTGLIPEEIEKL